ncbi:hypothetical protein [Moorena sp. SIO3H5]|uniref:hypothetical protein n=1 Tax=Moorena sp. SIO3H5 TaxID=2607834 RepID=UPI0025FB5A6E|nr:hypothetical protein [Moorena sp. SIO3H5]
MHFALVSVCVVLAGIAILTTGWLWFDPLVSLIIVIVVVFGTWQLLQDSFLDSRLPTPDSRLPTPDS